MRFVSFVGILAFFSHKSIIYLRLPQQQFH